MTPEDAARLRDLLTGQRLLALAVVVDGEPVAGLLPYALDRGGTALYVQASRLARHSRGLAPGAAWSGVIHEPDAADQDPLQVPRLVLEGVTDPLGPDRPERDVAAKTLLARFPSVAATLALEDFRLYRLEIRGARLILGFGRALNLSLHHFEEIATS
jgi:uncharacterized protein YhbP (UPF0306 family)